jgi:PhnB protein
MAATNTYLNFSRSTEEAFNFYRSVFGGDFVGEIKRLGEVPPEEAMPPLSESDKNLIMHIALPILGGHLLMGTDAPESMGFALTQGNNVHISLDPDTKEEMERLFQELSEGGKIAMPLRMMFWGAYFGSFSDKFGINWMINFAPKK